MDKALQKKHFTKALLKWFNKNGRSLPWKGENNPYYIWLSEIILQQTRVGQGLPYFQKFKEKFPTIFDLAAASEDKVLKLWQGLGYYSRARNLHYTSKYIANELQGIFPNNYKAILGLKGVGPYTAAAIASFAFGLPHAVVDGNVYRVLARVFGIDTPIDTSIGKKQFHQLANELIEKEMPGQYNQAIMDFGATHCTPAKPACSTCPMNKYCIALATDSIDLLPIKSKKIKKKERYFNYLVFRIGEFFLLKKRTEKDIWQNLYDFPLIETSDFITKEALVSHSLFQKIVRNKSFQIKKASQPFKQILTHQKIIAVFWEIELNGNLKQNDLIFFQVKQRNINTFAFPKIVDLYLKDKSLYLELF